jgi:hypothetical protein
VTPLVVFSLDDLTNFNHSIRVYVGLLEYPTRILTFPLSSETPLTPG